MSYSHNLCEFSLSKNSFYAEIDDCSHDFIVLRLDSVWSVTYDVQCKFMLKIKRKFKHLWCY